MGDTTLGQPIILWIDGDNVQSAGYCPPDDDAGVNALLWTEGRVAIKLTERGLEMLELTVQAGRRALAQALGKAAA